ncbi:MAG: DUF924 family protein [Gammaproteobacteria bacterium]|nr:DUF924 family protein [Gammaproteobacteria bacterium]
MIDDRNPSVVLDFWFSERMSRRWFSSTPALDREIRAKFAGLWRSAVEGGLDEWCATPEGALALIIVLDQFPLNMFRGTPEAFSSEAKAIQCTKQALAKGFEKFLEKHRLAFLYMPLMHSENILDQDLSVSLFEQAGLVENLIFAKHHREIIRRFGRFPHRNGILGRSSSQEELAYLDSADAFKG